MLTFVFTIANSNFHPNVFLKFKKLIEKLDKKVYSININLPVESISNLPVLSTTK